MRGAQGADAETHRRLRAARCRVTPAGTAKTSCSPRPPRRPGPPAPSQATGRVLGTTGRRRERRIVAVPGPPGAAEDLHRLIVAAERKRSIAVSSKLHPGHLRPARTPDPDQRHGPPTAPHAHACRAGGDSVRLSQVHPGRDGNHRPGTRPVRPPRAYGTVASTWLSTTTTCAEAGGTGMSWARSWLGADAEIPAHPVRT